MRILYTLVISLLLSTAALAEPIVTETTSAVITDTTVRSTPPSAISPTINITNSDLCMVGASGSVQTQILGVSGGTTVVDLNCERLKLSKTLYDMGMKVAAVSILCEDPRVFKGMQNAGTPCPVNGKIGTEATLIWENNPDLLPEGVDLTIKTEPTDKKALFFGIGLLLLLVAI